MAKNDGCDVNRLMYSFAEFMKKKDETLRAVQYKPDAKIPTKTFRLSGPEKMHPIQAVNPSRPYLPIFRRDGQVKTSVINRKH